MDKNKAEVQICGSEYVLSSEKSAYEISLIIGNLI